MGIRIAWNAYAWFCKNMLRTRHILCLYAGYQAYIVSMSHGSTTIDIAHYTQRQNLHSLFVDYEK